MSETLILTLPMPPSNINHMYNRGTNGRVWKNPEIAAWELLARTKIHTKAKLKKKATYCVNLGFYHDNKRKNDIDSKIKIVLDMLEHAGVYQNDSQVSDLVVAKRYDKERSRLEISVY